MSTRLKHVIQYLFSVSLQFVSQWNCENLIMELLRKLVRAGSEKFERVVVLSLTSRIDKSFAILKQLKSSFNQQTATTLSWLKLPLASSCGCLPKTLKIYSPPTQLKKNTTYSKISTEHCESSVVKVAKFQYIKRSRFSS